MNLTPEQMDAAVEALATALRMDAASLVFPKAYGDCNVDWPEVARTAVEELAPRLFAAWQEQTAAKAGENPHASDTVCWCPDDWREPFDKTRCPQHGGAAYESVRAKAYREGAAAGVAANEKLTAFLNRLRPIARKCGWAIAVHGSLDRDLDLIAAPWTDEATDAETLIDRLCTQADLMVMPNDGATTEPVEYPVEKPRGRRAWALAGCPAPWYYIDLSVVGELPMFRLAAEYRERARGVAASEARVRELREANPYRTGPDGISSPQHEAMAVAYDAALAALLSEEPSSG